MTGIFDTDYQETIDYVGFNRRCRFLDRFSAVSNEILEHLS